MVDVHGPLLRSRRQCFAHPYIYNYLYSRVPIETLNFWQVYCVSQKHYSSSQHTASKFSGPNGANPITQRSLFQCVNIAFLCKKYCLFERVSICRRAGFERPGTRVPTEVQNLSDLRSYAFTPTLTPHCV